MTIDNELIACALERHPELAIYVLQEALKRAYEPKRQGAIHNPIEFDARNISKEHMDMVERAIIRPTNNTLGYLNQELNK